MVDFVKTIIFILEVFAGFCDNHLLLKLLKYPETLDLIR